MPERDATRPIVVAGLSHDLIKQRSLVTLTWDDVADNRLVLDVPFGCTLPDLPREAEKALRTFASDIAASQIRDAD